MNETPVESLRTVSTLYYYQVTHWISEILFLICRWNLTIVLLLQFDLICHFIYVYWFFSVSRINTIENRVQDSQEDLIMSSRPNDFNDKGGSDDESAGGKCVAGLIWVISIILICCPFPFSLCICVRMVQVCITILY